MAFGDSLRDALAKLATRLSDEQTLNVGFMEAATYPDGTQVADVAAQNEYGNPVEHRPPRPFFRRMITAESPGWPARVSQMLKATNYDASKSLELMGEDISGALRQSINTLTEPALSARTVAEKGFAKPLIDTADMINSVTYEVKGD